MKRYVLILSTLACALGCGFADSYADASIASVHVNFAAPDPVMQLSRSLAPYHGPTAAECKDWYLLTADNGADRPATRVLQAGQPPGTGLDLIAAPTRPQIAAVASSDDKVFVERIGAYGRRAFRVTLPPASSVALAVCTSSTKAPPSLLAWTEPALSQHNRNLAIFVAAVAGLIGAAAAIVGGLAAMSGHAAPRWAAVMLVLVLLARLAATGMFDASLATPLGGPYGLMALIIGLALAAGALLADAVVPLSDFYPRYRRAFRYSVIAVVGLAGLAFVGVPGATDITDFAVVLGTSAIAVYLVQCGRMGSLAARVLAPSAVVFALVVLAAAATTLGGLGDNLIAGDAAGGFAAAGAVLLALAVAADEGLAGIDLKRMPPRSRAGHVLKAQRAELKDGTGAPRADAIAASHQAVFDLDFTKGILALSGGAALLERFQHDRPMEHDAWMERIHPDDRPTYARALSEYRAQPGLAFRLEYRVRAAHEDYVWLELRATMMSEGEATRRCFGLIADVTARKEAEAASAPRTFEDALTGLGNRVALVETLEELGPTLNEVPFALIDVDRFKSIHASLGDAGGDQVLVEIAHRLDGRFAKSASLFRVGGDSFAVLFASHKGAAAPFVQELVDCFRAAFHVADRNVFVTASVGVTLDSGASDPFVLIRNAELALIQAKRQGGNCARVYSPELEASAPDDAVMLEAELRRALDEKQLDVFYQPIIRLADRSLAGFEALLRWHHPRRGIVSPADFISHAERSGLILELGRYALARATRELGHWQRFFPLVPPLFVSVNVSRRQLRDPNLEKDVAAALSDGEIKAGTLKLEITETAIATDSQASEKLGRLLALGAGLSIDDFGTGVSSLSQLRDLPFDTVKIDKSFLGRHGGTHADVEGGVILSSIVAMAHELKRSVVVEGVENERDAKWLVELGCEFAQGFHFAPALPANEALNFIAMHFDPASAKTPPPMASNAPA